MPRHFRGEESRGGPEPGELREYKAGTMVEEYRGLAIAFAVLAFALAAYFIKSMLAGPSIKAPAPPSVYVEMIPPKDQAPSAR